MGLLSGLGPTRGDDGGGPPPPSPFRAGLACRCPRCGEGSLYAGLLTLADRCSSCGLDLAQADSGDGPAVFVVFVLGALIVPLALLMEFWLEPPIWLHLLIWPPVIVAGAVVLLRPFKATMVALQYRHKAGEGPGEGDWQGD